MKKLSLLLNEAARNSPSNLIAKQVRQSRWNSCRETRSLIHWLQAEAAKAEKDRGEYARGRQQALWNVINKLKGGGD